MMMKMVTLIYMPSAVQFACFSVTFGITYVNIIIIFLVIGAQRYLKLECTSTVRLSEVFAN